MKCLRSTTSSLRWLLGQILVQCGICGVLETKGSACSSEALKGFTASMMVPDTTALLQRFAGVYVLAGLAALTLRGSQQTVQKVVMK